MRYFSSTIYSALHSIIKGMSFVKYKGKINNLQKYDVSLNNSFSSDWRLSVVSLTRRWQNVQVFYIFY